MYLRKLRCNRQAAETKIKPQKPQFSLVWFSLSLNQLNGLWFKQLNGLIKSLLIKKCIFEN